VHRLKGSDGGARGGGGGEPLLPLLMPSDGGGGDGVTGVAVGGAVCYDAIVLVDKV
jgi:hypothetical protein